MTRNGTCRFGTRAVSGCGIVRFGWGCLLGLVFGACLAVQAMDPGGMKFRTWPDGVEVPVSRWAGEIVILDFFAPWCLGCRETTASLERDVAAHYRAKGGNPAGHPVRVVVVNVDPSDARRTAAYLEASGAREALVDPSGAACESLGGRVLPFVVVLDGTRAAGAEGWRVALREPDYPGPASVRRVVDGLGAAPASAGGGVSRPAREPSPGAVRRSGEAEMEAEFQVSEDVRLFGSTVGVRERRGDWEGRVQWDGALFDLDFEPGPEDFRLTGGERQEGQTGASAELGYRLGPEWHVAVSGGAYAGFANFRSVWLDEYYRQLFETVPGYRTAEPSGHHARARIRRDAVPVLGRVQAGAGYQLDDVSPGYEKPIRQPLIRYEDRLVTWTGHASAEQVIGRGMRWMNQVMLTSTTGRELRVGWESSVNVALAEHWVARGVGVFTAESPGFTAWSVGGNVDWDLEDRWFFGVGGRRYADNGQLDPTQPESAAAPPIDSWQAWMAVRWQGERWMAKLQGGPYLTDHHDVTDAGAGSLARLYRDRTWVSLLLSVGMRF